MAESESDPRSKLYFDPNQHPEYTLKAFEEFTQKFELRYNAQYPDPPKVSMDAAIERWKVANETTDSPNPKPNLEQYDQIRDEWRSKDKVAKLLSESLQDSYIVVGLMKSRPRFQFRKKYFLEKIFKLTKMAYFLGNVYACIVYPNKGKLSTFFKLYLLTRYFLD